MSDLHLLSACDQRWAWSRTTLLRADLVELPQGGPVDPWVRTRGSLPWPGVPREEAALGAVTILDTAWRHLLSDRAPEPAHAREWGAIGVPLWLRRLALTETRPLHVASARLSVADEPVILAWEGEDLDRVLLVVTGRSAP